jgi:hypothetical protein
LDWHLVVGANKQLTGLIAWDDMKNVARVSGSFAEDGKFHLAQQPVDGSASKGSVDGQFPEYTGWLTGSVTGAGCPHPSHIDVLLNSRRWAGNFLPAKTKYQEETTVTCYGWRKVKRAMPLLLSRAPDRWS